LKSRRGRLELRPADDGDADGALAPEREADMPRSTDLCELRSRWRLDEWRDRERECECELDRWRPRPSDESESEPLSSRRREWDLLRLDDDSSISFLRALLPLLLPLRLSSRSSSSS
jgi:hypothetical protein